MACLIAGNAFTVEGRRLRRFLRWPDGLGRTLVVGVLLLAAVRSFAVVTQRNAIRDDQIITFGTGASWWLPQSAAAFVDQHRLPAQMFASFNLSSYVAQRLGPEYRVFADGRYFPFGDRIVGQQLRLESLPLDDPEWTRAAARWDIRTVFLPLARFYGLGSAPLLADCNSRRWTPVFLDATAAIFVRNDALPNEALAQMRVDCARQPLVSPAAGVEDYQRLANAAVILYILGRPAEAEAALRQAQSFTRLDDSMFLLAGQLAAGRRAWVEARRAIEGALALHPSDAAWTQLGIVATGQGDLLLAMDAFRHAAALEHPPSFSLAMLTARTQLLAADPSAALRTLSAVRVHGVDAPPFAQANVDDLQAAAWAQVGNWPAAIAAEQHALAQSPQEVRRWQALAAIYTAAGQPELAAKAARGEH